MIRILIDAGADPNATREDDLTPLHDAARYHVNEAVVEALIEGGADVGARTDTGRAEEGDYTPLHFAAEFNENVSVTQALIDAGADVNARETEQRFPLFLAVGNENYLGVMEALLRAGADPTLEAQWTRDESRDSSGRLLSLTISSRHTALHRAVGFRSDRLPAIEALIDTGVDVDLQSLNGVTPLMLVASLPHAELLLEMGADVRRRNQLGGTALHNGGRWKHLSDTESLELIALFVNSGADVNARTEDGETPLHHAAASGVPDTIAALVAQGADVDARDVEGNT